MHHLIIQIIAAAAGGAVGAASRFAFLQLGLSGAAGILVLNVAGSFGLGFAAMALEGKPGWVLAFIGAGLFGGLTTFSTFAGDAARLMAAAPGQAALYVAASVILAIAAFASGAFFGRAL